MPIYGITGQAGQYFCKEWQRPTGAIEMQSPPPSCTAIAEVDGTWSEPAVDPLEARKAAYKAEADDLYMDYKAAEEEGQDAAAVESLRQTWLARRAEIKAAWPK